MTALLFMRWEWSGGGAVTHFQIMTNLSSMLPSHPLTVSHPPLHKLQSHQSGHCCDMPTHSHPLTLPHTSPVLWFCHFKTPVILHHNLFLYLLFSLSFLISLLSEGKLYDGKYNRLSRLIQVPKGFTKTHVWSRFINYTLKTNQQSFDVLVL